MTCHDCGKDVAVADTPSGMTCCVSCRLKQIEAMPAVRRIMRYLSARTVTLMTRKQLEETWDYEHRND